MSDATDTSRVQPLHQAGAPIEDAPLSYDQEGRLFLEWWLKRRAVPFVPVHVRANFALNGPIDVSALEAAINLVIQRHETLRTAFSSRGGPSRPRRPGPADDAGPGGTSMSRRTSPFRQVIHPHATVALRTETVALLPGPERDGALRRLSSDMGLTLFDYEQPPLLRAMLIQLPRGEHVLLIGVHHLVCDGVSMRNLMSELSAAYAHLSAGRSCPLPDLPVQYADFARWQRDYLRGDVLRRLEAQARRKYHDFDAVQVSCHSLRCARPRGSARHCRPGHEHVEVDPALAERIRLFARKGRMSVYMVLLAALATALHLHTRKANVGLWGHFANRTRPEFERLIGLFATLRLLAIDFSADPAMADVLRQARDAVLEANAEELPFALLWNLVRATSANGARAVRLFDEAHVSFNMVVADRFEWYGRFHIQPDAVSDGASDGALRFTAVEDGPRLDLWAGYSPDLLERSGVVHLLLDFRTMLDLVVQDPHARVSSLARQFRDRPPGAAAAGGALAGAGPLATAPWP